MKAIMFVCFANTCRSAMACHYMQKKLYDLKMENDIIVSSCGISAYTGQVASKYSIIAMKQHGVDMSKHRATNILDADIEKYDLILCMTSNHKNAINSYFPKLKSKVYTLKEYCFNSTEKIDIEDPWGYNLNIYSSCAQEIVECVDKLLEKL